MLNSEELKWNEWERGMRTETRRKKVKIKFEQFSLGERGIVLIPKRFQFDLSALIEFHESFSGSIYVFSNEKWKMRCITANEPIDFNHDTNDAPCTAAACTIAL